MFLRQHLACKLAPRLCLLYSFYQLSSCDVGSMIIRQILPPSARKMIIKLQGEKVVLCYCRSISHVHVCLCVCVCVRVCVCLRARTHARMRESLRWRDRVEGVNSSKWITFEYYRRVGVMTGRWDCGRRMYRKRNERSGGWELSCSGIDLKRRYSAAIYSNGLHILCTNGHIRVGVSAITALTFKYTFQSPYLRRFCWSSCEHSSSQCTSMNVTPRCPKELCCSSWVHRVHGEHHM